MSQLDLLLVNPCGRRQIYQDLGNELTAVEPPVWCGFIATYMRNKGCSVKIIDAGAEELDFNEVAKRVKQENPRLVAMMVYGHQPSASTQNMPGAGETCKAIKKLLPDQKIIISGTHPSALPEQTLREEEVDFVCDGEGPITFLELLQVMSSPKPDYSSVKSLWYWNGDKVSSNPPALLIKDLDKEMPMMAWDLLPMEKYRAHNWHCFGDLQRQPYASLYTTLGCPYHCSFCCIQAPFKAGEKGIGMKEEVNSYRAWSPKLVVDQMELLATKYGVRNIKIEDEMFVLNEKHVIGICDEIIARGLKFNIWAYSRIDTVRDSMLEKLKKAGFNWLAIGIESASKYVRDGVDKSFGKKDIKEVCDKIRNAGICIGANFIFGLPDDTMESMQETLDMAIELCPDWANFYSAMAYPGSALYKMAVDKKWKLPETWIGYSQHSYESLPLPTDTLAAGQVLAFRDEAFVKFFTHPRYLSYVKERFGQETVDHIHDMLKHKLARKHAA
ncbi:MAG: cobalamin-dependent protein [Deltaproteobacteria bacterium]|nr:cobalamin-dependent protein [Deltaproteobacteria bacterium]